MQNVPQCIEVMFTKKKLVLAGGTFAMRQACLQDNFPFYLIFYRCRLDDLIDLL